MPPSHHNITSTHSLRLVLGGERRPEVAADVGEPHRHPRGGQGQHDDGRQQQLGVALLLWVMGVL